jgi:hypothetical protein
VAGGSSVSGPRSGVASRRTDRRLPGGTRPVRRIVEYPNLSAYLRDLDATPGAAETVDFDRIKRHYYITHTSIDPTEIVPAGPVVDLTATHGRVSLVPMV